MKTQKEIQTINDNYEVSKMLCELFVKYKDGSWKRHDIKKSKRTDEQVRSTTKLVTIEKPKETFFSKVIKKIKNFFGLNTELK